MVAPAFGFSVGDFVAVTKLLITLFDSFNESGGASTKYASEKAFLTSLTSTVLRLSHHVQNTPHDDIAKEIVGLLQVITEPLKVFRAFLDKHASALEKMSTASSLTKARLTISFTMKEISGNVEKLRRQIEQPIHAINSLLALQVLKSIENASKELLRQEQLEQIVEAIRMADIPSELEKQIGVLQRFAAAHDIQNTEHIQRVIDMHGVIIAQLNGFYEVAKQVQHVVSDNQASLEALKAECQTPSICTAELEQETKKRNEELDNILKEQRELLVTLKSFPEDKITAQKRASHQEEKGERIQDEKRSWPKKTLTTAQLAMALLSVIVPNVAVVTITRREQRAREEHRSFLSQFNSPRLPNRKAKTLQPSARDQQGKAPRLSESWPCSTCGTIYPLNARFCVTCIPIGSLNRTVPKWVSEYHERINSQSNDIEITLTKDELKNPDNILEKGWSCKLSKLKGSDIDKAVELGDRKGQLPTILASGSDSPSCNSRGEEQRSKEKEEDQERENVKTDGNADGAGGAKKSEKEGKREANAAESKRNTPGSTNTESSSSSSRDAGSGRTKSSGGGFPNRRSYSTAAYHQSCSERYCSRPGNSTWEPSVSRQDNSSGSAGNFAHAAPACNDRKEYGHSDRWKDDGLF